MAVVALVAGCHVRRRFSGRLYAIVTGHTGAGDRAMVDERYDAPGGRNVTIRAQAVRRDMAGWPGRGSHNAVLRMAADASRIRCAERATDMATFAGNACMCAVQVKASAEMIEGLLGMRGNNELGPDQNEHVYETRPTPSRAGVWG